MDFQSAKALRYVPGNPHGDNMLEARKVLEDHEKLNGFTRPSEHTKLTQLFTKATTTSLKLSASQC
jgi:hypothetical protein